MRSGGPELSEMLEWFSCTYWLRKSQDRDRVFLTELLLLRTTDPGLLTWTTQSSRHRTLQIDHKDDISLGKLLHQNKSKLSFLLISTIQFSILRDMIWSKIHIQFRYNIIAQLDTPLSRWAHCILIDSEINWKRDLILTRRFYRGIDVDLVILHKDLLLKF